MLVVAIVGALGGALLGGCIYAIAVSTIPTLGAFGPGNLWWKQLGAYGLILGFITGFFLGFILGSIEWRKVYAALLGGVAGLAIAVYGLASYLLSFGRHVKIGTICTLLTLVPLTSVFGIVLTTMTTLSIWRERSQSQ